ncbi:hypothetical protein [Prosthecobacter sp.]|uniref:hypothetical protein n=1 Tax=Prosthecobacter sp. TaxID=1965333 RepID=UPI003782FC67
MSTPPPLPPDPSNPSGEHPDKRDASYPENPFVYTGPPEEAPYQMAPVTDDASAKPEACVACGAPEFSSLTEVPVCETCRVALIRYPYPKWVKGAAAAVFALTMVALGLSIGRIQDAYHFTRAKKMVAEQRWEEACQTYRILAPRHTDNETATLYAEAAFKSGHHDEAMTAMHSLQVWMMTTDQRTRAGAVLKGLEKLGITIETPAESVQMVKPLTP